MSTATRDPLAALSEAMGVGSFSTVRLRLIFLLAGRPMYAGELCRALDARQPNMSHLLAKLRHCGVVEAVRDGRRVTYALTARGKSLHAALASFLASEEAVR